MRHATCRLIRAFSCLAALVGVFALSAPARAQGTMNQLPDPMNSKELTLFLERYVDPTFDQWVAIEEAQDVYYEKFEQLRDGEIARFLKDFASMQGGGMPSREQIIEYIDGLEKVNTRIRRLDVGFFESISGTLREDQHLGLERARLARERIRLRSGVSGDLGMGMSLDLWECMERTELDPEQVALVDIEMREYEQKLTKILRKWNEQSGRTMVTMFDELEALGYADMDMSDPANMDREKMQAYMMAIREAFGIALGITSREAAKSRELNARTIFKVAELLGGETAWNVKCSYVDGASIWGRMRGESTLIRSSDHGTFLDVVPAVDLLLDKNLVSGQARDSLLAIRESYIADDLALVDQLIRLTRDIDPMSLMMDSMMVMSSNGGEEESELSEGAKRMQEVAALSEKRMNKNAEARDALVLAVSELEGEGSERVKRIALVGIDDEVSEGDSTQADEDDLEEQFDHAPPRSWIITAMDFRDLARIRRFIGCEDWQYVILESLHEDYLADWRESVHGIDDESWISVGNKGHMGRGPDYVKRIENARRRGMAAARELDESFFDNLLLALSDESASHIRVARIERMYEHAMAGHDDQGRFEMSFGAIVSGREINPVRLVVEMDMTPEMRSDVVTALLVDGNEFMDAAQALQEQRFKNACRIEEVAAIMSDYDVNHNDQRVDAESDSWRQFQEVSSENERSIAPFTERVEDEREQLFQRLANAMSSEVYGEFEKTWRVKSYPDVYKDRANALPVLKRARELGTVSQEQIAKILAIEVEFEIAWEECCDRMIQLASESGGISDWQDSDARAAMMDHMARYQRIQFQRDELGVRTLRRLARVLNNEQRSRIRALRTLGEEIGETGSVGANATISQ